MKIGIIQVHGLGDIVIALPIAAWFIARGHEVLWPVHRDYYDPIQAAVPTVQFLPVDPAIAATRLDFFYHHPLQQLQALGCEKFLPLYSRLTGADFIDEQLAATLPFDEYKYAVAGVPFSEKWRLELRRDPAREQALYTRLNLSRPYICVHRTASNHVATTPLPAAWQRDYEIVEVQRLTDNPLDWLYTLEHAAKLVLVDSCFANLAEGLNFAGDKYLLPHAGFLGTPVLRNDWTICDPRDGLEFVKSLE